jgi:hypothetical protein
MIRAIKNHLLQQSWPSNLTILWDHDHDPESERKAEEPTLYTGEKNWGRGRPCRNGAVDVMVRDELARTVQLLVEVEPDLDPKKLWGDVGVAMDSDRHVPSYMYCDDSNADEHKNSYALQETLLIVVTICGEDKEEQLQNIVARIRERFSIPNPSIEQVIVCTGKNEEGALTDFSRVVDRIEFDSKWNAVGNEYDLNRSLESDCGTDSRSQVAE